MWFLFEEHSPIVHGSMHFIANIFIAFVLAKCNDCTLELKKMKHICKTFVKHKILNKENYYGLSKNSSKFSGTFSLFCVKIQSEEIELKFALKWASVNLRINHSRFECITLVDCTFPWIVCACVRTAFARAVKVWKASVVWRGSEQSSGRSIFRSERDVCPFYYFFDFFFFW